MLPTGHVAAGYLTAVLAVKVVKPEVSPAEIQLLYLWGMWFGFMPDLDEFWFFLKNKSLLVNPKVESHHRSYLSHVPIFWLLAGLIWFGVASDPFWKTVGLLLWLGSWSHFLLDSIEYGIMWLWPFSKNFYALKDAGVKKGQSSEKDFIKHSWEFLKYYSTRLTFKLEILIIFAAIAVFLNLQF